MTQSTQVSQVIKAPREVVYQAFLDPKAVETWLAPDTMKGHIDHFEPREGGTFRMSLTYLNQTDSGLGKTSDRTDTFEGKFIELVPNEKIIWVTEFDSDNSDFAGEMRIIWTLKDAENGTDVTVLMEDIPNGIRLEDNELGSKQSLQKLTTYVERSGQDKPI
jgi:uncharacterized protein YndB with AHSA1/START domain